MTSNFHEALKICEFVSFLVLSWASRICLLLDKMFLMVERVYHKELVPLFIYFICFGLQ